MCYVCRNDPVVLQPTYTDFLDEYIDKTPLDDIAFNTDSSEVYTYLVKFVTNNDTAESKIAMHSTNRDGRTAFLALRDHYEGVGVHALDITKADRYLDTLFYSGERRPHMWWGHFELLLNEIFTIYNKREGRIVHSEEMKLRILCRKVTADFLQVAKSAIQLQLAKVPITISYDDALTTFRNAVNAKFPPELAAANSRNRSRRINELSRSRGGGGRSFNARHSGRGRGGRGNRSGRNGGRSSFHNRRRRSDARMVRCTDGTEMEVHPSYQFNDSEWGILPDTERNRILEERRNYKRGRNNNDTDNRSLVSEITTGDRNDDLCSIAASVTQLQNRISSMHSVPPANANETGGDNNNRPPSSVMGGRNEQSQLRGSRHRN